MHPRSFMILKIIKSLPLPPEAAIATYSPLLNKFPRMMVS